MSGNGGEQRHFSRVPFDCEATIIDHNDHWPTQLLDVSLNGALVTRPQDWQPTLGDECELRLKLANSNVTITMEQAAVAHIHEDRVGFKCKIIDVDSITHLKRLVELNLGDPELVHRELLKLGQQ
jgi:hypothetical protein